jgi:hypothetical protein
LGRDGRSLVIICAYQVCQKGGRTGTYTAYSQQVSLLRRKGFHNPNPRLHFINDLTALVSHYQSNQADIILMGDFNEVIGLDLNGMAKVVRTGHLTDVQTYTYARGPNRVDYIFSSERLLPHIHRQGCEPFSARIFSDHRGIFLDLAYPGIFDRAPNIMAPPTRRNLRYDCPKHVLQYLEYMSKYISDHSLVTRAIQLQPSRNDQLAETLDRDITIGLLAADHHCKNYKQSPWSTNLHNTMTKKYILLKHLSQLSTSIDLSAPIQRMQQTLDTPIDLPLTIKETQSALRITQKACRVIVRNASNIAKQHQEDRIAARQLANPSIDPEKIAKKIRSRDAMKEMWQRIPSSKPRSSSSISMIKIPRNPNDDPKHPNTEFRTVVDPIEMESLLISRNQKHFSQARDTPFASNTISDTLGWGAHLPPADLVLDGSYDLDSLTTDRHAKLLLQQCQRINPELPHSISLDETQKGYLNWNINTSTSPSGRHLSHQHILFHPSGSTDPEEIEFIANTKSDMWLLHHAPIQYATTHGYCFNRWHQVVNTMIEKEPGNPMLHRLRVIHLYESDYNLILGIKFRQLIRSCLDKGQFNPGCYGGLANKQALDPVFLELMQYDYTSMTLTDHIKFANDAGSCYDRIIASPSNILARSRGLHKNIAALHGNMLETAVYRIKTQLGISSSSYSHSLLHPVFGTGQGSRSSALIWNVNGSSYLDAYDSLCHGALYEDPTMTLFLTVGMAGFVNDNSCQSNCHPRQRGSLIARATHDAQLWSDLLYSSGGILEHDKCSYHYMRTDFDQHGAPILRAGSHGDPIIIRNHENIPTALKQLSVYTLYKTLGTFQCPGSNPRGQADALIQRSKALTRTLATSNCHGPSA